MEKNCYVSAKSKFTCNVQRALHIVGEKWMLYILREFIYNDEKQNFNKLLKSLKPISSRTLSLKLKKLQDRGLVTRNVINSSPIKVNYKITKKGMALKKTLVDFGDWFAKHN